MKQRDLFEHGVAEPLSVPQPKPLPRSQPDSGNMGRPEEPQAYTDCQRILNALRRGPQLSPDLQELCMGYRQRISDLRKAGFVIKCRKVSGRLSQYSLEG